MGSEIVTTVVDAFKNLASGIAGTAVDVFNSVFTVTNGDTTKLSNLAIWGLVSLAIGLGVGLVRKFTSKAG